MRRVGFAVGAMSVAVAACGRIVTVPKANESGGAGVVPAGNMYIRYRTLGPLSFSTLHYIVAFNTSGNGLTPYAPSFASFTNYSFILVFGGNNISGAAYALFQIVNSGTSAGFQAVQIPIQPQFITNFNPNSPGTGIGNEFTFTFNRQLLNIASPVGSPSPSPSPSLSPTPTPTPTATATATGSPSASPSPSPTPSPSPVATPTLAPGVSTLWALNLFSADLNNNPIDAISNNGVNDTSFNNFVIDTTAPYDVPVNKPLPPIVQVNNQSAQIIVVEIINTP